MTAALAIVDKRRVDVNEAEVMNVIGDVDGRTAIIVDDMIDTAGTLVKTTEALLNHGASAVYACCTHAVLSGKAVERICQSKLAQVVVTNSIPLTQAAEKCGRITTLSVGPLLARAIQSIHEETSVSNLFI
jgi:ribose-phosphate pyrophosphokinase